MKQQFYLTLQPKCMPKLTKKRPNVTVRQACMFVEIDIPDSYFFRPALLAKIQVEDLKIPRELKHDAMVNAKSAIEAATGLNVNMEIIYPPEPEAKIE